MGNRVRLTNDTLNSYGYRVLTDGVDITQYERNPILLYMHNRGKAIGLIKDIKKENGEITGELAFDEATELSTQCKKQWDFGSLRMVSIGFEVIETSEAAELIVPGQRYATVTKARLIEVSLVDIGANNDAIRLHKDGQLITLSEGGDCPLPRLNHKPTNNQPQMDIKTLALTLGLPETADEAAVNAKLAELKTANDDVENIRRENEQLKLSQVTAAVDAAIAAKKIPAEKKQHFLDLGKKVGIETLNATLDSIAPAQKLSATLQTEPTSDDAPKAGPWELRMAEIRENLKKQ
ncbi:peptidase [Barnesiella sp. WM24]|uniref:HK97 family phage prohead protease n=1 Tax=Barnesiella sp. WM24 TaxID=2558278 RepID=UPI001071F231|nr:HK97 family phage prohead protease [Barnesiella sp. WM24]TFU93563.1 peptidase [Barnesiella sp. WM24]